MNRDNSKTTNRHETSENRFIIWSDAAQNTVRRRVGTHGRLVKFHNGGYRIGIKCGESEERHYNRKCPDSFAAECYSVLKAIDFASRNEMTRITVRNDRIDGFDATRKRGYSGARYLYVARKIAEEHGIDVVFERCTSKENLADRVSRSDE